MANTISVLVKDTASAQLDFQSRAVFPLPLDFNRVDTHVLGGAPRQCGARTEIKDAVGRMIGRQELFFGRVAQHGYQGLIDVEKLSLSITPAYSIGGIVHQRVIQRLRMLQGLSGLFQFRAQFFFVYGAANGHGQWRDMLSLNVIEGAMGG